MIPVNELPYPWLINAIEKFIEHSPQWNIPILAEGSCWTASKEFSDMMRELKLPKTHIEKVCFNSKCETRKRCFCDRASNLKEHKHDLRKFYPFQSKRMEGYDMDHRYNYLELDGKRINIDFTAKQFDEELPYPLIWVSEENG